MRDEVLREANALCSRVGAAAADFLVVHERCPRVRLSAAVPAAPSPLPTRFIAR